MNKSFAILCRLAMILVPLLAPESYVHAKRAEILDNNFRTLKILPENFMDIPVLRLGTNDRITISFDEISDASRDLRFRLIHCNADWKPSRLLESEYLDAFNEADIEDFAFSTNTFIHFVNYHITLPDERMPIIASGNYLVEVYDMYAPDNVLLRAPFKVSENTAVVQGYASSKTDFGVNDIWQQLSFTVDPGLSNINPYADIIVTVAQNSRAETERTVPAPIRVNGNVLVFEHANQLIFPASNEYRRFETVRVDNPGMHVDSVRWGGSNYHHYLKFDEPRVNSGYSYDQTQHGRFLIHDYYATDADIAGDYVTVHFTLECPEIQGADVFVDGEFTHGLFSDANRMKYDYSNEAYHLAMPLKQGAYNYQYVVREAGSSKPTSTSTIEGDKYETRNEYEVNVYFRPPGARADRLIGNALIYSR